MENDRTEQLIGDLRRDVMRQLDQMANQISGASQLASAAQSQIIAHVSVCDERQRRVEDRQNERRRWEEDRTAEWKAFMKGSQEDRERLSENVAKARLDMQNFWIKILLALLSTAGLNTAGMAALFKSGILVSH